MRRRWMMIIGAALLVGACTASSTSNDDSAATSSADPSATTGATAETTGDPELGGLTRVSGTIATADIVGALESPAPLPLALTVPAGGGGNGAVITGVEARNGDTVVWDGGRPITLSGDGTIQIQPGPFRVGEGGLFADMSGAAHALSPGSYAVAGPVAVGDGSGLASPSTDTAFTAGAGAVLSGTGQVEGRLPAGTWLLLGPGSISFAGDLMLQTSESAATVATASMQEGSFEVTLIVADDGSVRVEALLDGTVVP